MIIRLCCDHCYCVEHYLRLALAGLESHLGTEHVDLLESMEGLGNVLYENKRQYTDKLLECEVLFDRALHLREHNFGKNDKSKCYLYTLA